jgi:hypothetical protein
MSFKKTLLLLSLYLFAAAPSADAGMQEDQSTPVKAYFLKFKDAKDQKALLKKAAIWKSGDEYLAVGEAASDAQLKLGAPVKLYQVILPRKAKISKTLAEAPYEFGKDGMRKPISKHKKAVISIPSKNLVVVNMEGGSGFKTSTLSDFGLYSLCSDLERRRLEVEELRSALKELKQTQNPAEWKKTRNQLLLNWGSLVNYVENFPLFEPMGGNLRAEFNKAKSKIQEKEKADRMDEFRASVKDSNIKEVELDAPGGMKFHEVESKHIRIVYLIGERGITDDYAKELMLLGEQTIEFFRSVAIDPYPEFVNQQEGDLPIIPPFIFQEYFIGPDDTLIHKDLYSEQYGREMSDDRVFEAMTTGATLQGSREEPLFLSFSKNRPGSMKGLVVHQLGHSLSSLHYNQSDARSVRIALPVIQESVARFLCFEKLGSNNLRCTNFNVAKYEKQDAGDGKTKVLLGDSYQKRFFKLSLRAPTMEACAIVPLNKLNELHMAKGWMTYYYIINQDGLMGQQWLRNCHDAVTKAGDGDRTGLDRNVWRDSTKELAGKDVTGDPLHMYEERLKKVAEEALEDD